MLYEGAGHVDAVVGEVMETELREGEGEGGEGEGW